MMRCACGIAPARRVHTSPLANKSGRGLGIVGITSVRTTALILTTLVIVLLAAWVLLALWFQAPGGALGRSLFVVLWALFSAGVLLALWRGPVSAALGTFVIALGMVLIWWHTLKPSNQRAWADDVARTGTGEVEGDQVTL